MVNQIYDDLLHIRTRHTNLSIPRCNNITGSNFPEQDKDKLCTYISLKHRDMYVNDDLKDTYEGRPEMYDPNRIYTEDFYIVRFDVEEPYRLIGISKDYKFVIINDTRYYNEKVSEYPIQITPFISLLVKDQYCGEIPEVNGVTIRVDNGEPCYSVIAEFYEDNSLRFVLGDECFTKLFDYYKDFNLRDYNGHLPKLAQAVYVDADGKIVTSNDANFYDINGGVPNHLLEVYRNCQSREEVAKFIKELLKGRKIYGSV